jgi:hypothetical protein
LQNLKTAEQTQIVRWLDRSENQRRPANMKKKPPPSPRQALPQSAAISG